MLRIGLVPYLRAAAPWVLAAAACGPLVPGGDGSSDGGVGEGTTTTSGTTTSASGTGVVASDTSSGTTVGSSSSGEPWDESGGCGFLCPPDATHPEAQCDPIAQDCPAGQKCVWYVPPGGQQRREAARCIEVTGDAVAYEPCTLPTGIGSAITDDCGPDSYCLEVYGTADHGYCAPFYRDEGYPCQDYLPAIPALENGSEFPSACLHYECHPFVQDTCPPFFQCTYYPAFLYGTNMCWYVPPEADLPLGAECDYGECGEGELCVPAELTAGCTGERCCTQWCDLNAPACDDPATQCELFPVWDSGTIPEFEWLGACVLPGSLG